MDLALQRGSFQFLPTFNDAVSILVVMDLALQRGFTTESAKADGLFQSLL